MFAQDYSEFIRDVTILDGSPIAPLQTILDTGICDLCVFVVQ